jgi:hypothetical protein
LQRVKEKTGCYGHIRRLKNQSGRTGTKETETNIALVPGNLNIQYDLSKHWNAWKLLLKKTTIIIIIIN